MNFKDPFQISTEELNNLIFKKMRDYRIEVSRITKRQLRELASVEPIIQRKGLPDHLVLKKLKKRLGSGIFLHPEAEPILKGQVIAPYAGELALFPKNGEGTGSDYVFSLISDFHLTREEQEIWDPKNRYHPRRFYAVDLDAEKRGNFTRFINHSSNPNIEAEFLQLPAKFRGSSVDTFEVIYIAKKKILPGEQLMTCYEGDDKSYWGASGIKPFPMTPQTFRLNQQLQLA